MTVHRSREAQIRSLFDTSGHGLEIGPSYNPIVPKRDGFDVEVVDHLGTAALRAKYAGEPNVNAACIEEVDHVWGGQPLSELIGVGRFDYVVASHVIEHVPDLLGFLRQCELLLKPSGTLVLAVPDQRRCFDLFRPLTSTGSVLQAHHEGRQRHLPGTAFDHVAYFATLDGAGGWGEGATGDLRLEHPLTFAQAVFDRSANSTNYHDFHAWVFTPSSFRLIIADLCRLGLLALREASFQPTPGIEFLVTLSRDATICLPDRLELLGRSRRELQELPSASPADG